MKIKTAEATGLQLDWGVAVVVGEQYNCKPALQDGIVWMPVKQIVFGTTNTSIGGNNHVPFSHTHPAVCMANIASYKIDVRHQFYSKPELSVLACWGDEGEGGYAYAHGKTLAEAVARCVIAMKLGDEFEVPDELGVMS